MTPDMILVLAILGMAVLFLVTEWIPMEVTALLVLGAAALTGLVGSTDALSGFSNPAVVTVWAVFILSGGLTRTGVANKIGRFVLTVSGVGETRLIIVIMICAGLMSAIMNNVAVAALMMPVVMDIARQTGNAPSRLLLPLAYGSLLGGLTTQIGTPPNILVSEALRDNGLRPFGLFDFTPVGLVVMAAGVLFVAFVGKRFLPERRLTPNHGQDAAKNLENLYRLGERLFRVQVPEGSRLVGKSLAATRLGSVLGLNVVGITRAGVTILEPGPDQMLHAGDQLIVAGRVGEIETLVQELRHWSDMHLDSGTSALNDLFSADLTAWQVRLPATSDWIGQDLVGLALRHRHQVNVLAIRREDRVMVAQLQHVSLRPGDLLLIQGDSVALQALPIAEEDREPLDVAGIIREYRLDSRLLALRIPEKSFLNGKTLRESRLGETIGVDVLAIRRNLERIGMPGPEEVLLSGDTLVVTGRMEDLALVRALADLEIMKDAGVETELLENESVGFVEAMLSPHSDLSGKTLRELRFRSKYGLSVLAVWREGNVYRSELGDMPIRFGDALLLHGDRKKFALLGGEPDFVVLTESAQETPRTEKANLAMAVMAGVLLPVMMGWVPIYIAAVIGAAVMVLSRCLTMEEAYRCIEWKGIFLIAGMMPLGEALNTTGAAKYLAAAMVSAVGAAGPLVVMAGLMALTFLATCVIPTAALVVLMTPIVLNTAADLAISPHALMMAVAMSASSSFMTPISHPANVMVMGPGGYRFSDYLKIGLPLTLLVLGVLLAILPVFWPLMPVRP